MAGDAEVIDRPPSPERRRLLQTAAALPALLVLARPAQATPDSMRQALAAFTGGAPLPAAPDPRLVLDIAALVENGNTVPVTLKVQSPMTAADHVRRIGLYTEKNPEPGVGVFHLSPRNGRAEIATRMRLATSQLVVMVAEFSDGRYAMTGRDVLVTLAACVEG